MAAGILGARRNTTALPGFGLALGVTLFVLGLIVLAPLIALVLHAAGIGLAGFVAIAGDRRTLAALRLSFTAAAVAAAIAAALGLLIAWVLVRYRFPGRRLMDAAIDLPFALPTAVAGIALTAIYVPDGVVGALAAKAGVKIAFTPLGIVLALVFVGLPFVVRSVAPVLAEAERESEEAAVLLGASRLRTVLTVILPGVLPALLSGFAMAFARGAGEYGSVIFIAGNIPRVSEIAPLLIVIRLEEFDYAGATVIACLMLALSFVAILAINTAEALLRRRLGHV